MELHETLSSDITDECIYRCCHQYRCNNYKRFEHQE